MFMTFILVFRSSVMKFFIKRNIFLRVDFKVREFVLSFVRVGVVLLKVLVCFLGY